MTKKTPPRRILIVCAGNTCRSPMAEAMARSLLIRGAAHVESAGAETTNGLPATQDAVQCMREIGIDISAHRSRELESVELSSFDLVLAMTSSIEAKLRAAGVPANIIEVLNVPDPYGRGIDEYRRTAQLLQERLRARLFAGSETSP
jgi:protein-tyrosine-phosphatase